MVHAIKWAVQRARYITLESIAPISDVPSSACQQWPPDQPGQAGIVVALGSYTTIRDTTISMRHAAVFACQGKMGDKACL